MGDSQRHPKLRLVALAAFLSLCCGATGRGPAAGGSTSPPAAPDETAVVSWAEIDELIEERRYQAALERVSAIRERAQQAGDEAVWTRALVREVQLTTGLHGYETSVRHLRQMPWPEAPLYRAVLELYYAHSLVDYLGVYGWEIRQRERVESAAEVDLGSWTREQIGEEVDAAYGRIWAGRHAWGEAPLGELAEYFDANDHPRRIRGTLRDAVSYLWAEWLADSSHWSAAEENGVYLLDLAALVEPRPEARSGARSGAPAEALTGAAADLESAHPLARLAQLLADLESWHRAGDRLEAAFEARLELLRRLRGAFARGDDRALLRQALERALDELGRELEWWAVGQEMLASWVRQEESPDSLVRAREIALEGIAAHPDSVGGRRCRHLVAAIEAPEYSLEAMSTDGLDRRSVRVRHRNLDRLSFRAWRLDALATIESAEDRNLLPARREVEELLAGRRPDAEWRVELPPTSDYRLHQTYVTPPLDRPGLWVLAASPRADFGDRENRRSAVRLLLGDLVLLSRQLDDQFEVTVRSGGSGDAVAGAEVRLYRYDWRGGHRLETSRRTGADGTAGFAVGGQKQGVHYAVALHAGEIAVDPRYLSLRRPPPPRRREAALVYTDRSVYRPGQEVLWKVVAYGGRHDEGSYRVEPGRTLEVGLEDANGERVETAEVTTNDYGSASGAFRLPRGRLLGGWRLTASTGGGAAIRVEEYKRPTFEVEIAQPGEPLRLNRPARLRGEARYYFGLPVAGGELSWRVTREPVWSYRHWWRPPPASVETVAAGRGTPAADGTFAIDFTPRADERQAGEGVSFRYRLSVDVTDEGGETRSAERSFRLGFVAVEARLDLERGFVDAGETAVVSVRRSDLDGAPRPGRGGWRLLEVAQPDRALLPAEQPPGPGSAGAQPGGDSEGGEPTPGDRLRPRWDRGLAPAAMLAGWPDGEELLSGETAHGDDGEAEIRLPALTPGVYRLRYETRDPWQARFETQLELVVAPGSAAPSAPPALPALLSTQHRSVPVGGSIRLLVHSGLAQQEMVLEVLRAGDRIERLRLDSSAGPRIVEIPVTAAHRGGLGLRLTLVRDHQQLTLTDSVFVPWDERRLEVSFATFRDRLRPGERETWRVMVRGAGEEALAGGVAELLAYMYDRSLDLFAPHQPPRVSALYPVRGAPPGVRSSLGAGGEVWAAEEGWRDLPTYPGLRGDRLVFYPGYGIGGPGMRRYRDPSPRMAMMAAPMQVGGEPPPGAMAEQVIMESGDGSAMPETDRTRPEGDGVEGGEAATGGPVELRSDFSETAFWEPHLVLGEDGTVAFEFTVPDSVTEWSVWVHALTRDLAGGSIRQETKSVKQLLVRPYLPRFLREGDRAVVRVLVNNAGEAALAGSLTLDILDPESEESLLAEFGLDPAAVAAVPFEVAPGGGAELDFELAAPLRVGEVAVRAVARAGELSDGELRLLPLLPGRLHLAQSRFAALKGEDRRVLIFSDLAAAGADPGLVHDQLVVTLDAQLLTSVLRALPYLVDYPYECTEQTLNRFLSTGVLTSLYDDHPAVTRLAEQLAARESRFEPWDAADPNRKIALEETPWRTAARGGGGQDELLRVLDPRIARAQQRLALDKLAQAQTSLGGFPWWPGGPPSPHMTLYLLHGFARAVEFGVEIPRPMVQRAWSYVHRHYLDELVRRMVEEECCWELVTFLNYVLSAYPDDSWTGGVFDAEQRRRMLEHSWAHWREHSPLLKGYLALTLDRAGRAADARRVFESLMDSARTDPDLGTFWAPEERAWLWYNDTVEGHAFALRALTELAPDDARRHGLVQWLLLDKKLNHWKSTRATAEVLYALVHYLQGEGALGVTEEAAVTVGPRAWRMRFEPDDLEPQIEERGTERGTERGLDRGAADDGERLGQPNQIVIPGAEIDPATMSSVVVEKATPSFLFASATWHFSTDRLPAEAEGDLLRVSRRFFRRVHDGGEWVLQPLAEGARVAVGDAIEVELSLRARHAAEYVHLRDPRGAGFEPETQRSGYRWDLGIGRYEEIRDSGTNFFFEHLPAGEYTLRYRLRAATAGTFRVGPATLQSMYAPEFTAYSAGDRLTVE
jgi:hypothetical protein